MRMCSTIPIMSTTGRLILFSLAVTAGAALAAAQVISGDAWLTLTLGLLLPSPLEGRRGGPGQAAGMGAGVAVLAVLSIGLLHLPQVQQAEGERSAKPGSEHRLRSLPPSASEGMR